MEMQTPLPADIAPEDAMPPISIRMLDGCETTSLLSNSQGA